MAAKKAVQQRKLNLLTENLVNLINQLYHINEGDINIVLADEMFLTDLNEDND